MTGQGWRSSLAHRLFVAQVLVIAAMAIAVVAVAAAIGPAVFDQHLMMAGHGEHPETIAHAEAAFRAAGLTALGWGLAIAGIGATAASLYATSRIGRALRALADGAERVSLGDYTTPIAMPGVGRELETVASSFATMAERLASAESTRRRMLTDLSHELRTPVAAIDLMVEGMEDGVVPLTPDTMATLRQQTARLARLADDLGEVSAAEEGRLVLTPGPVQLVDLLTAARDAAAPSFAAAGVSLALVPVTDGTVEVDVARIGQVLDNLLRNALQHTTHPGSVELLAGRSAGEVWISVRDTGQGIAAADLPHIFERFYRGDHAHRRDVGAGTGVGLAISRAIAVAHGGTLTATSKGPGQGAEFVLRLPNVLARAFTVSSHNLHLSAGIARDAGSLHPEGFRDDRDPDPLCSPNHPNCALQDHRRRNRGADRRPRHRRRARTQPSSPATSTWR